MFYVILIIPLNSTIIIVQERALSMSNFFFLYV